MGYYAASCGNCLPTFRDNVSVPSSRVKSPSRKERKPATYNADSLKGAKRKFYFVYDYYSYIFIFIPQLFYFHFYLFH
jgi:hypothetical protein